MPAHCHHPSLRPLSWRYLPCQIPFLGYLYCGHPGSGEGKGCDLGTGNRLGYCSYSSRMLLALFLSSFTYFIRVHSPQGSCCLSKFWGNSVLQRADLRARQILNVWLRVHTVPFRLVLEPLQLLRHAVAKRSVFSIIFFSHFIKHCAWKWCIFFCVMALTFFHLLKNHGFSFTLVMFINIPRAFIWHPELIRNAYNILNYRSTFWLGWVLPEKALTSSD